jgi:hypothetical protein
MITVAAVATTASTTDRKRLISSPISR